GHDLLRRPAREEDIPRRLDRDFEPEEVNDRDDGEHQERKPREQPMARRCQEAPDPDAEKRREENEIREVRQKPDVRRHPPDEGDFEKEDQEGREKNPDGAHRMSAAQRPSFFSTSSGQPFHSGTIVLPTY